MLRYKLIKSIKRASVGTFSGNSFPESFVQVFLKMAYERQRALGVRELSLMQASKGQEVRELKLPSGEGLFSASFDVGQFNEPLVFSFNDLEVEVANPFTLTGDYSHSSACEDVAVRVSENALEIAIRWVTLELTTLHARDEAATALCQSLSQNELPCANHSENPELDRLILSWVSSYAPLNSRRFIEAEFDPNDFLGALWNRLSDCLNVHLSDSLEQYLDESGDCSAIDGEESLEIALDR